MKLLIIDDSENIRKALIKAVKTVQNVGQIEEASNVKEAIEKTKQFLPDLIVLDFLLKDKTAIDYLEAYEKLKINCTIILYSNILSKQYVEIANDYGVKHFFDKSHDVFELISIINKEVNSNTL